MSKPNIVRGQLFVDAEVARKSRRGVVLELKAASEDGSTTETATGYLHISKLVGRGRTKRDARFAELVARTNEAPGTKVTVQVTHIKEKEDGLRVAVSEWHAKRTLRNQRYAARKYRAQALLHKRVTAPVYKAVPYGVFLSLDRELQLSGLLHISKIAGENRKAQEQRLAQFKKAVGERVPLELHVVVFEVTEQDGDLRISLHEVEDGDSTPPEAATAEVFAQ